MGNAYRIGFLVSVLCLSLAALAYGEGSLGVNVPTPQYNFDMSSAGAMKSQMHFSKDGNDVGGWITSALDNNFFLSSGAVYDASLGGWIQKSPDGKSAIVGTQSWAGYQLFLQTGCTAGAVCPVSEKLRVDYNGNVGIGTTTPQGRLDVNGTIYQRGAQLHADYVFEPTYTMESIEEHALFMWKNKHLKAVPGVQKDENGMEVVEVGSHQRGILEELEKAHVYIEQLNEKIKELDSKLKAMEKK